MSIEWLYVYAEIQLKSADATPHRGFQRVVVGGSSLVLAPNTAISRIWAECIRAVAASHRQINRRARRRASADSRCIGKGRPVGSHRIGRNAVCIHSIRAVTYVVAITGRDHLASQIRVPAGLKGSRQDLVQLISASQMNAYAADVRNRGHRSLRNLVLNIEVPLLHVGPSRFGRNRTNDDRRRASTEQAGIEAGIAGRFPAELLVTLVVWVLLSKGSNKSVLDSLPFMCS